jgi:hypothetical protein
MSKRMQLLVIIFFVLVIIAVGGIFILQKIGYLSSQAISSGSQCPTKCRTLTFINAYAYNKSNNNSPVANAKIYARTDDCNRADVTDRDTKIPWSNSGQPVCLTNTSGYCKALVCGGGGNYIKYYVNASKNTGNCTYAGNAAVYVPVWPGGTGLAKIYGPVTCP